MKLTNTHRLILEMLLRHPEGIRREDINAVLWREGERILDDRRRLFKYLDSFRKSLCLNIATVHLGATDFKYRLCGEALPFKRPFMLTPEGLPLRSFQGPVWRGGFSDHLPLVVEFTVP